MAYADLREFLARLEQLNELTRVSVEVDPRFEVGAVARRALDLGSPALLFERPKGYRTPLVVNMLATRRRVAVALECREDELPQVWVRRTATPLPPELVRDGPCKEHILLGDEVDIFRFPMPVWNEFDGGPFISLPCHISRGERSQRRNAAVYRAQVHDRQTLGLLAAPYRHILHQRNEAKDPSQPFPVAVCLGVDPVITLAALGGFEPGVDELAMAGALRGAPLDLVPCETIPLEVPATAEIVLEGEIPPGELRDEGPFGDVTGYYGVVAPRPIIRIKAITHRGGAIHAGSYDGRPPQENAVLQGLQTEVELFRTVSLPGLKKINVKPGGSGMFTAVAAIEKKFEGYGKMMALAILGCWVGRTIKTLVIVDEDIDPFNEVEVDWAIATRVQARRDVDIIDNLTGMQLDPSLDELERSGPSRTSKLIIDATRYNAHTFERPVEPPREVMQRVLARWEAYGIPEAGVR
ncbi:MAG: UbiD family decarboxylase [Candidatus Tectomicrobia bacterium]|nr:UbiD family decarboxylase [Candidatus Tectomicrobia bacterium]